MNSRSGLSLFELLISLVLLSLISIALMGALNVSVRVYTKTSTSQISNDYFSVSNRLRNWLVNAMPPNQLANFEHSFLGTTDELAFTTLYGKGHESGAAALRIGLNRDNQNLILTVSALGDQGKTLSVDRASFSDAVALRIRYLSVEGNDTVWKDNWDYNYLPKLVAISIGPDHPALVVYLHHSLNIGSY